MTLELVPFGRMRVWADLEKTIAGPGPIHPRTVAIFSRVLLETPEFTLESSSGSGGYMSGADVAQIEARIGFKDSSGVAFFMDYLTSASMPQLLAGKGPGYMTGRIDVSDDVEKYAWLNRTQIVGKCMVTFDPLTLNYELYTLR